MKIEGEVKPLKSVEFFLLLGRPESVTDNILNLLAETPPFMVVSRPLNSRLD